jgi:hypothetical protein
MTNNIQAPIGFEARLLEKLTEVDAKRSAKPEPCERTTRTRRRHRRLAAAAGAAAVVVFGGTAAATVVVSGVFDSAPPQVKQTFAGLDGHGHTIDSGAAVRIGVIDDHEAYAAPTSGGGFCLYFTDNARSGPKGGSCITRNAAPDEAEFSVLLGTDGGIVFGRVGTTQARQVTATFPRSGDITATRVAESGFFAAAIPSTALQSLTEIVPPDPSKPSAPTKDGGPVRAFQLDRIAKIRVVALDANNDAVAHGVYVLDPDLAGHPTGSPTS